ncbi:MAG: FecR domain-containing protein [Bacteroidota bacterium]
MSNSLNEYTDQELLVRYLSKETSALENRRVEHWLNANDRNKEEFNKLKLLWEASSHAKEASLIDVKSDWQKVKLRIDDEPKVRSLSAAKQQGSVFTRLMRVAAVITFLVVAYLTWPVLSGLNPAEMTTITALSDTSAVVLADGSKVLLNKNSRLVYPEKFSGNTRTVTLEGEAFFDVVKDPSKPFLIKSGRAITEVVGTSFSVNAGIKNKVLVTVVTGKVLLYNEMNQEGKLAIVPGEQGQLKNESQLLKKVNDDLNFLSWKTGVLTFQNTPINKVIKDLSTHYDRPLKLGSSALKTCTLTATFDKQPLENVLDELQLVLPIQILMQDKKIILTGTGCQ